MTKLFFLTSCDIFGDIREEPIEKEDVSFLSRNCKKVSFQGKQNDRKEEKVKKMDINIQEG